MRNESAMPTRPRPTERPKDAACCYANDPRTSLFHFCLMIHDHPNINSRLSLLIVVCLIRRALPPPVNCGYGLLAKPRSNKPETFTRTCGGGGWRKSTFRQPCYHMGQTFEAASRDIIGGIREMGVSRGWLALLIDVGTDSTVLRERTDLARTPCITEGVKSDQEFGW